MSGSRRRAILFLALTLLLVAAGWWTLGRGRPGSEVPVATAPNRPTLLLLTSLPIVFGEGFSLENNGSAVLTALERRYRVVPVSVSSATELAKGRLLLMAQPPAQSPEHLVALDNWVRAGGRVLLLADPLLEWPSDLPLGDPLRPPVAFSDTGLLGHWGLRLDAPDRRGRSMRRFGGREVATVSPGSLSGACGISIDRFVARCRIGKGNATVAADADLLDVSMPGTDARNVLDSLVAELDRLGR